MADGDGQVEGGPTAAARLVTIARCTGIVCYNDLTAIGALRAVRSAGLRVPEDIGIVGFDDIDLAAWIDPPLTTVRQPTGEMGRWAVDRLVQLATSDEPIEPTSVHLEPELVVRGSTAPIVT